MTAPGAGAESRPWKLGLLWLAFLGPLFFASYGFTNWVASRQTAVGAIVFEWERAIPFLPWTIVPYWLIDALYALSLVLCSTRAALAVHVRRLLAAQLIAVACFLAFPLRFTFERPAADGWYGLLFALLSSFDQPFNQAPSLHIALLVILLSVYLRAVPRRAHGWVYGAAVLIGLSVLTTWQHHFIDLPTGAALGGLCVWLIPDQGGSLLGALKVTRDRTRLALARNYALGSLGFAALALAGGGVFLWLLWPAGSLVLVALVYAAIGERGFQKSGSGRIAPAAAWLLAPYLAGAWLNSRWWTRRDRPADAICADVWLGRAPSRKFVRDGPCCSIVDVCAELPCPEPRGRYICVPMLDLVPPSSAQIEQAAAAIERARKQGPVLVCCALGYSRSAVAACAWLIVAGYAKDVMQAIDCVRIARPRCVLGSAHAAALLQWQRERAVTFAQGGTGESKLQRCAVALHPRAET